MRVRIRGVNFYAADQEISECLLSRALLQSMGFNLKEHLERVHHMIDDKPWDYQGCCSQVWWTLLRWRRWPPYSSTGRIVCWYWARHSRIYRQRVPNNHRQHRGIRYLCWWFQAIEQSNRQISWRLPRQTRSWRTCKSRSTGHHSHVQCEAIQDTQRRYAPAQREFIVRTIHELEAVGAIYKNNSARWASPALAVPKPGSLKLRFNVDLRGPNLSTVPIQSAMPHLESLLQNLEGSTCFANVELAHGYWQILPADDSKAMMSIQTPIGVYSFRRLVQGGSDSWNHIQVMLGEKFQGRAHNLLQWLNDFLFYSMYEECLLDDVDPQVK